MKDIPSVDVKARSSVETPIFEEPVVDDAEFICQMRESKGMLRSLKIPIVFSSLGRTNQSKRDEMKLRLGKEVDAMSGFYPHCREAYRGLYRNFFEAHWKGV